MTEDDILQLTRREVRYHLYRIRTHEEGGTSHRSNQIKSYYEVQEDFTTWSDFARKWDIGPEPQHHKIVKRRFTEEQEWNQELSSLVGD